MHPTKITTVEDIVELAGGLTALAKIANAATPQQVNNWRTENTIPSRYFVNISGYLADHNCCAPISLFGMKSPRKAEDDKTG